MVIFIASINVNLLAVPLEARPPPFILWANNLTCDLAFWKWDGYVIAWNLLGKTAYKKSVNKSIKNYNHVCVCTMLTEKMWPELICCFWSPPGSFMKGNDHSHLLSCRLNQRRSDSEFRKVQSTWTNLLFEGWNNWTHHVLEYNLNSRPKLHIKEKGAGRTWYGLPAYAPTMNEAKAPGLRVQPRLHSKTPLKAWSLKGMGAREQQSESSSWVRRTPL